MNKKLTKATATILSALTLSTIAIPGVLAGGSNRLNPNERRIVNSSAFPIDEVNCEIMLYIDDSDKRTVVEILEWIRQENPYECDEHLQLLREASYSEDAFSLYEDNNKGFLKLVSGLLRCSYTGTSRLSSNIGVAALVSKILFYSYASILDKSHTTYTGDKDSVDPRVCFAMAQVLMSICKNGVSTQKREEAAYNIQQLVQTREILRNKAKRSGKSMSVPTAHDTLYAIVNILNNILVD